VNIVPETAQPDSFGFDNSVLTSTSKIFKVGKADLLGWLPQSGDKLELIPKRGQKQGKIYTVQKTGIANTHFSDVGCYDVMIRILVKEYRGEDDED
jgi:predicted small secreted protein